MNGMKSPSSSKATSSVSIEFFAAVKSMVDASSKVVKATRNRKRRIPEQPEQQQQDNEESRKRNHFFTPKVQHLKAAMHNSNCRSRGVKIKIKIKKAQVIYKAAGFTL